MATRKRLIAPFAGWKEDKKTRGWYAPEYNTYKEAPYGSKISRRQYDKDYSWQDYQTNWKQRAFKDINRALSAIAALPPSTEIIIVAKGTPTETSPGVDEDYYGRKRKLKYVFRTILRNTFASSVSMSLIDFSVLGTIIEYYVRARGL